MPRLKFVNLSFNCLSSPLEEVELTDDLKWQNLRNLVMNSTQVPWKNVQCILDHLPSLEELHLSLNEYDHVNLCSECCKCYDETACNQNGEAEDSEEIKCTCSKDNYKKKHKHTGIKKVHFTGNPVNKWSEVCKIGYAFPSLESLVVADCPIKSLDVNDEDETNKGNVEFNRSESNCEADYKAESPHDSFRQLKFLNINSTNIATWDDIERLAKFPVLQCLRVQVILIIMLSSLH